MKLAEHYSLMMRIIRAKRPKYVLLRTSVLQASRDNGKYMVTMRQKATAWGDYNDIWRATIFFAPTILDSAA